MCALADNAVSKQAQSNPAFVLTKYFSYLRRDPDHGGFEFWLHVLHVMNGGGNYSSMVCSFITSTEYQHRFSGWSRPVTASAPGGRSNTLRTNIALPADVFCSSRRATRIERVRDHRQLITEE